MIPKDRPVDLNPPAKQPAQPELISGAFKILPMEVIQIIASSAPGKDLASLSMANAMLNKVTIQLVNTNLMSQLKEFKFRLKTEFESMQLKPLPSLIHKQIDEALSKIKEIKETEIFKGVNISEISSSFKTTKNEIIDILSKINLSRLNILLGRRDTYPEFFKDIMSLAIIQHLFDNKMAIEGIKRGISLKQYDNVLQQVLKIRSKWDKDRMLGILAKETLNSYDMDLALKTLDHIKDKELKKASITKLQQPWGN
jgi:hypothetical protein